MRIAVIGGGISGLVAAYRLGEHHGVTLFEQQECLGGHAHTVDVELHGRRYAIDTGFIVFNDRTYPHFCSLLDELQVPSDPTRMSLSVRCDRTGLEYNGSSLAGLFAQRRNLLRPAFYRLLAQIVRFNRHALSISPAESASAGTIGQFLGQHGYSRDFAEHYLLPMGSAIWSCPADTFEQFPFCFLLEFFRNHGLLELRNRPIWRTVRGGSRTYVRALAARLPGRVRLNTPIESVRRDESSVTVTPRGGVPESFDHVVFACHSDQALRLLADPTPTERTVLAAFPYQRNIALLHTDTSVLPRRRRAWASWNCLVPREPSAAATVTYCMNLLQHIRSDHVFSVSLNCEDRIDPRRVLGQFVYEHPVFTLDRAAAQTRHAELINARNTSYCGAYWRNGFHEDGVASALTVCEQLLTELKPGNRSPQQLTTGVLP